LCTAQQEKKEEQHDQQALRQDVEKPLAQVRHNAAHTPDRQARHRIKQG
jgi:hypothetical protein